MHAPDRRAEHTRNPVRGPRACEPKPGHPDPARLPAAIAAGFLALTLPALLVLIVGTQEEAPPSRLVLAAEQLGVSPQDIVAGQDLYMASCAACHAADAGGMARLGKPLRNSAFVRSSDDDALFAVIAEGRMPKHPENTTGSVMPPRGAKNLSDEQIHDIVAYVRSIQDPDAPVAAMDDWMIVPPGSGPVVAAAPAGSAPVVDIATLPGHDLFVASCSACHGADAGGLEGLGVALDDSDFVRAKSDKELLGFIKTGRTAWDPESKTGVDMPAKGGNPALGDEQIAEIVSFIRALNQTDAGGQASTSAAIDATALPGHDLFLASCSACHGADAGGMEGLGVALTGSGFVRAKDNKELLTFIKTGRTAWDPESKTGVDMPAKGGNPALGDDQINDIIAFIRALDGAGGGE